MTPRRGGADEDAALSKESARLKDILRPLKTAERENLRQTEELLRKNPAASELAAFEKTLVARALAVLQKSAVPQAGVRQFRPTR